jgi:hypothetical protein
VKRWLVVAAVACIVACGGPTQVAPQPVVGSTPQPDATPLPPAVAPIAPAPPDVEVVAADAATVGGLRVPYDGIDEGLVWPKLQKVVGKGTGTLVIQLGRDVSIKGLLRAAFTLRARDIRVQTPDATGAMRVVELRPKPATPAAGKTCHLAVFVEPTGGLRVAAPGGGHEITGASAAESLARTLEAERASCTLRYVAFGAESDDVPFGPVFDLMLAVDRAKSAGDARYVLGEAVHPPH